MTRYAREPSKYISRRQLIYTLAAGGGVVTAGIVWLPTRKEEPAHRITPEATELPGAFVILRAETVVIRFNRPEMGQGTMTSMPMLIAEELEVAWEQVSVEWAPTTPPFTDPMFYGVEWSSAVRDMHVPLRKLGAGLRELFVEAAAKRWGVPAAACFARDGRVHRSGNGDAFAYAELAADLADATLPDAPTLKTTAALRILGRRIPNRLNGGVVAGATRYGIDLLVPQALTAVIARPPNRNAQPSEMNLAAAKSVPGVVAIEQIAPGVAVVARDFWSARQGLAALDVQWNLGEAAAWDTQSIRARMLRSLNEPPTLCPLSHLPRDFDAPEKQTMTYEVPYQAHAALEPTSAVANVSAAHCDVWMATQNVSHVARRVARALERAPQTITVHPALMGGSFGRKYEPDPAIEAALLSQRLGKTIRVIWTREDEMQNGPHRPAQIGRFAVMLGPDHLPRAIDARYAGPSYFIRTPEDLQRVRTRQSGYDSSTFEGLIPFPYPLAHLRVSQSWFDPGITVGSWRSTAHSFTTFFIESLVDELAFAAGEDPAAFRLRWFTSSAQVREENLPKQAFAPPFDRSRMIRVIEELRTLTSSRGRPAAGTGRGMAVQFAYEGYSGAIIETQLHEGRPRIMHAWLVADVGQIVNRSGAEQQLIGGFIFGLTAATKSALTVRGGKVEQTNFHEFELLRMQESPPVDVYFVESAHAPAGLGEAGVPLAAPALANSLFAATGRRCRRLPISLDAQEWVASKK